ncbi:MAG: NAD(P)-dependent alcohol dehydrogenase [Anaerolineae bacterium]|nr:NAD(P)-dependent alcohol dehydrogenase [Anaerolineae bacterium]
MKAIIQSSYGSPNVLQIKDIEKPMLTEHQVLIRVQAASVNALDWRRITASPFFLRFAEGLFKPNEPRLGKDVAGRVEAVGTAVTRFKPGDEVFGVAVGSFAEYAHTAERNLALKPSNISFESAAAVPVAALTALQSVRDTAQIKPGQQVLVYGAGGGVGMFAVQIAKYYGAHVTAVCGAHSADMIRAMGADRVLDYAKDDFTRDRQHYDAILAVNGYRSILTYRRALKPDGIYVVMGGAVAQVLQGLIVGPLLSRMGRKQMRFMMTNTNQQDLVFLKELLEAGTLVPVIDRCYPLKETVAAISYLMAGHTRGKVVVTMGTNPSV